MDDRRFDSLTKSLARGASRREVLKGLLGLGGVAVVGGTVLEGDADAARRPTPTPRPPTCPGRQVRSNGACACPSGLSKCGPDCCNDDEQRVFPNGTNNPNYTECCDNACCQGKCFGEELCCPYTRTWCEATQECCPVDLPYCCGDGCCARPCCDTSAGNVCCEGDTPKCCPGDICIPTDGCCTDAECPGCQSCENHICVDDRANCPGGVTGCDDCVSATCVANSSRCDDGQTCNDDMCDVETGQCSHPFNCHGSNGCCTGGGACTNHTCLGDGTCDYSPNCNGNNDCCDDGNACTSNICNGDGSCSNPFYCTSDTCCSDGQLCDEQSGACYTPCQDTNFGSCDNIGCCSGLTCIEIPELASFCFECIPSTFEGIPVPCIGVCELCCSGMDYLGFCVDCNPPFNSCQDDENSCCSGLCCQYNPFGDNFCSVVCV